MKSSAKGSLTVRGRLTPSAVCAALLAMWAVANDKPQWGQRWSRNMVSD
jgi:hypothetical protein